MKKREAGTPDLKLSWQMSPHSETTDDPLPSTHSQRLPSISHNDDFGVHHFCPLIAAGSCSVTLCVRCGVWEAVHRHGGWASVNMGISDCRASKAHARDTMRTWSCWAGPKPPTCWSRIWSTERLMWGISWSSVSLTCWSWPQSCVKHWCVCKDAEVRETESRGCFMAFEGSMLPQLQLETLANLGSQL